MNDPHSEYLIYCFQHLIVLDEDQKRGLVLTDEYFLCNMLKCMDAQ